MNFKWLLVTVLVVLAIFARDVQAGSKRWRKFEKKFKHGFEEAKEALPVVQGYVGIIGTVAALGRR